MAEETVTSVISEITDQVIEAIKNSSAYGLPDRPSERGMSAEDIKRAFYAPLVSAANNLCSEINRIVREANAVSVLTKDIIDSKERSLIEKINNNKTAQNTKNEALDAEDKRLAGLIGDNKSAQNTKNEALDAQDKRLVELIGDNKSAITEFETRQGEKNAELTKGINDNKNLIEDNKTAQDKKNSAFETRIASAERKIDEGSGNTVTASMDPTTYVMRIALRNALGREISSASVDLPLESLISAVTVSDDGDTLTLTLTTGQSVLVDVTKIVRGLTTDEGLLSALDDLKAEMRGELVAKMAVIDQRRIEAYEENGGYYFSESNWKSFIGDEASGKFGYNRAYVERSKARGTYGMYALSYNASPIYNAWYSKAEWAARFAKEHPNETFREPYDDEYPLLDSIVQRGSNGGICVPLIPKDLSEAVSLYYLSLMNKRLEDQLLEIKSLYEKMRDDVYGGTIGLAYRLSDDGTHYVCIGLGDVPENSDIEIAGYLGGLLVTEIDTGAFSGKRINSVFIPETINYFRYNAFGWGGPIGSVYIKDLARWCSSSFEGSATPVTAAHPKVYINGMYHKDLVIPEGVKNINARAFMHWVQFTTLTLPSTITTIANMAFQYCSGLTALIIPKSMQRVLYSTFGYCTGLKTVTFKGVPREIAPTAFEGCEGLTDIYVPWNRNDAASVNSPWGAVNASVHFADVTVNETEGLDFELSSDGTYYICTGIGSATDNDIVIPYRFKGLPVKEIAQSAFYGATASSIDIPSSVVSIGSNAFYNCKTLTYINVNSYEDTIGHSPWGANNAIINWVEIPPTVPMVVYINGYNDAYVTTDVGLSITVETDSYKSFGCRVFEEYEVGNTVYISGTNVWINVIENATYQLLEESITDENGGIRYTFRRYKVTITERPAKIYMIGAD